MLTTNFKLVFVAECKKNIHVTINYSRVTRSMLKSKSHWKFIKMNTISNYLCFLVLFAIFCVVHFDPSNFTYPKKILKAFRDWTRGWQFEIVCHALQLCFLHTKCRKEDMQHSTCFGSANIFRTVLQEVIEESYSMSVRHWNGKASKVMPN